MPPEKGLPVINNLSSITEEAKVVKTYFNYKWILNNKGDWNKLPDATIVKLYRTKYITKIAPDLYVFEDENDNSQCVVSNVETNIVF